MKRRTLKILSLLLVAVLLLTGIQIPISVSAAGAPEVDKEQPDDTTYPTIDGDRHGMYSPEKELTIVIFGEPSCPYTPYALKAISEVGFSSEQVDICYVDIFSTKERLEAFIEAKGLPDGITYCYTEFSNGSYGTPFAWEALKGYVDKYKPGDSVATPSYVFTDKDGTVQHFRIDSLSTPYAVIGLMDSLGYGNLVPDEARPDCIEVECEVTYDQTGARQMLGRINEFRTGDDAWYWDYYGNKTEVNGLEALTYDYELEKVAMQRAAELIACYEHNRPNEFEAASAFGREYNDATIGENVVVGSEYYNYQDGETAFIAWKEENEDYSGQGHRRTMLYDGFKAVGIAHVVYNGYHYWVQEFSDIVVNDTETEVNTEPTKVKMSVSKENIDKLTFGVESIKSMKVGDIRPVPQVLAIRTTTTASSAPDLELSNQVTAEWQLVSANESLVEITDDGSLHAIKAGTVNLYIALGAAKSLVRIKIEENSVDTDSLETKKEKVNQQISKWNEEDFLAQYGEEEQEKIKEIADKLEKDIADKTEPSEVQELLDQAKADVAAIKTEEQKQKEAEESLKQARSAALKELDALLEKLGPYRIPQQDKIITAIEEAQAKIKAAENEDAIKEALEAAKQVFREQPTDAELKEQEEAAKKDQDGSDTGNKTPTASLTLDKTAVTLYTGKAFNSETVTPTVTGKSKTVTWKTSNSKVATVKNGKITAVGKGTATVTATANKISKTVQVTVKDPTLTIKNGKKKFTKSKLTVKKNKKVVLTVTVDPKDSGISITKLTAKQRKIASVTLKKGKITIKGKQKGSFTLQIKSGKATKKIKITVK